MKQKTKKSNNIYWVIVLTILIFTLSTIPGNILDHIFGALLKVIASIAHIEKIVEMINDPTTSNLLNYIDWSKVGHFLGYSFYGYVLYQLCKCNSKQGVTILVIYVLIVACIDEFIQSFTYERSSSVSDVILDTSAALLAIQVIILKKVQRK
jgi:VanZ family protein